MFRDSPRLNVLRSLTRGRTSGALEISQPDGPILNAPMLDELTIDLTSDDDSKNGLRIAPKILACMNRARCLRDITLRLHAAFRRPDSMQSLWRLRLRPMPVLNILPLHDSTTTLRSTRLDVAGAIAAVLASVHAIISDFATESNRARAAPIWNRLPAELTLEMARWLPRTERVRMLGVSRDVRKLLLSDTSLWTSIPSLLHYDRRARPAEYLQVMALRSGSRPVDLEWPMACVSSSTDPDPTRDLVLSILPRTRSLLLHSSYFHASGPRTFWTTPTPLLQELTIADGGTRTSCANFRSSWKLKDAPLLRDLKLGDTSFWEPPSEPWRSIVHLEATMGISTRTENWTHLWAWFPRLQSLVLHVKIFGDPPALASPPESVRHVVLHGTGDCQTPERVVRDWAAHNVQKLEIFSDAKTALRAAVDYLKRCESEPWTVSFVTACCPTRGSQGSAILRGRNATVVVRSSFTRDCAPQIREARAHTVLRAQIQTLTLSGPALGAMFRKSPTLPILRSLELVRTAAGELLDIKPRTMLRAPALERLTIDLTHDEDPVGQLGSVPRLVNLVARPQPLCDIIIRLPAAFDGTSPALAQVRAELAPAAQEVRVEYSPSALQHDYPSVDIEHAVARALEVFQSAVAQFSGRFNTTRAAVGWDKLPAELKLGVVRWLPLAHRAKMLSVSRNTRTLLIYDPSLWTTISATTLSDDVRPEYLRTMVARSGTCPLDITWDDTWEFASSLPIPPRIVIYQARPRVRTLTLDVSYFLPGRERFWTTAAPLLNELVVTSNHGAFTCTISPDLWSANAVPALRTLKVPNLTIFGTPRAPFNVVHFQANVTRETRGLEWLWHWFPHLETLVVYVCNSDVQPLPLPPNSLRHVVLYAAMLCEDPVCIIRGWAGQPHGVRLLEVFGAALNGLPSGLNFLAPDSPLSVSFAPACRPQGMWRNSTIIRGGDMTVAFWAESSYDQRLQIHTPGLMERLQTLTLGAGVVTSAFREDVAFPNLRSLTAVIPELELRDFIRVRSSMMRAPSLEELVLDITAVPRAEKTLGRIPEFVSRIEHSRPLRAIVLRLAHECDRYSPTVAEVSTKLAALAADAHIEYHPASHCPLDPCICSESWH
ncbi:hypothetical protein AURDEDRAFT_175974 [Auricularia subglabra TFB-10046 SS5]|nr:hypothetical protein AURDEDRAFT_175974 [Auricularia subglabra TFB-10046 SS5]